MGPQIDHFCRRILAPIMLPTKSKELQPCKENPYIKRLPTEIVEMIIREYATLSVTQQRSIPTNFLFICRSWKTIGENRQQLFTPHLVVYGHDEMEQLLTLYEGNLIRPSITSLTVNLALEYAEEPLDEMVRLWPIMVQIQQDLERLRHMFFMDWVVPTEQGVPSHWRSLNLEHFSLVVDLSAVSARKTLLKAWTRSWVSRLSRQWRGMGWTGSEGIYHGSSYSYWDR